MQNIRERDCSFVSDLQLRSCFARGKASLETMIYLTFFDCRHGFRSTLKLSQFLALLNGPYFGLCQTYAYFNRTPRSRSAQTLLGPNRNFYLAIGRAKQRGSAKVAFSVANSEIRWAELVPSRTVLTLSVQNGPACSKSALEKLGPIWPLASIQLFSFYSV